MRGVWHRVTIWWGVWRGVTKLLTSLTWCDKTCTFLPRMIWIECSPSSWFCELRDSLIDSVVSLTSIFCDVSRNKRRSHRMSHTGVTIQRGVVNTNWPGSYLFWDSSLTFRLRRPDTIGTGQYRTAFLAHWRSLVSTRLPIIEEQRIQ